MTEDLAHRCWVGHSLGPACGSDWCKFCPTKEDVMKQEERRDQ